MKGMPERKWFMLALYSVLMCISMSLPIFGGGIVNTAMARALRWDTQSLGLLVAANMLAASLLLPFAPKAIGRFGVRGNMVGGFLAMIAGALVLANFVTRPGEAVVAYGVAMGGTSAFSGVILCQTGVVAWFPNRRTLAFSILYAGTGLTSSALLALISFGITMTGAWQTGWYIFAGLAALAIFLVLAFVREPEGAVPLPRSGEGALPAGAKPDEAPFPPGGDGPVYPGTQVGKVYAMPLYWIVALSMIAVTAGSILVTAQSQIFLIGRGFSAQSAALPLSVMQIGMIIGNLSLAFVTAKLELRRSMALALVSFAIGFAILANVHGFAAMIAFALFAGVGYGAGQVGSMVLIGHYWDMKIFPMLTATGLMVQTIGSAAVPVLAGRYNDTYRSLVPPFYAMTVLFLGIALALVILGREPREAKQPGIAACGGRRSRSAP